MQFNGHSDEQDLVHLAYDLSNTNSVTYPLKEMARAANKTLRKVWTWIFAAYGGWIFDDANNTDFPASRTTLEANKQDYNLPEGALVVRGIDILPFVGATIYQPLKKVTEEDIRSLRQSDASFLSGTGVPQFYRPIGTSFKLYPTPNATITAGLRVSYDRGMISFASTDTVKQPGFANQFHEVVASGMDWEYRRRNSMDMKAAQADMEKYEKDIKAYYSSRFKENHPAVIGISDETTNFL
jgi:hypothetical protein